MMKWRSENIAKKRMSLLFTIIIICGTSKVGTLKIEPKKLSRFKIIDTKKMGPI
jgi:hypothetical protein